MPNVFTALRALAILATFIPAINAIAAEAVATPKISGPITGGTYGRPFVSALMDLAKAGYVEREYFLEGKANVYGPAPGTALTPDGRWQVVATGSQPYKTRILVRLPTDPKKFNGTVVVEWFQASAGFDKDVNWMWQSGEIIRSGYAWVGVSAQRESVNGTPAAPPGMRFKDLARWDAVRYGSLDIPSEDLAYDIFSQVGKVVGAKRPTAPIDVMAGLKVEKVIPIGDTFAADKLVTYYNAAQPIAQVFDGFFIGSRHIKGAAPLAAGVAMPEIVQVRADVNVPVIISNTDAEALAHFPARQPDNAHYRLWEIAGAAHTNAYWAPQMYAAIERDLGTPAPVCADPFNAVPNHYVMSAALWHLNRWVRGGPLAPSFPPVTIAGTPPALQRDSFGNTLGGVRLPEVTVPVARYETAGDRTCPAGSGRTRALPSEEIAKLYPTRADYVAKYKAAAEAAVKAGSLLRPDADAAIKAVEAQK
jgi:hypothetical protein